MQTPIFFSCLVLIFGQVNACWKYAIFHNNKYPKETFCEFVLFYLNIYDFWTVLLTIKIANSKWTLCFSYGNRIPCVTILRLIFYYCPTAAAAQKVSKIRAPTTEEYLFVWLIEMIQLFCELLAKENSALFSPVWCCCSIQLQMCYDRQ